MKRVLVFASLFAALQTGCLVGDPNPYEQASATGGNGSGGASAGLRTGVPSGTAIAPGTICSPSSSKVVTLNFENTLSKTLSVSWVGYGCEENLYTTLTALGTYQVQSYEGHIFRLRDEAGSLLFEYTADGSATQTIQLR